MSINNTTTKRIFGNLVVFFVSIALSVVTAEFLARIVLDPVDYFAPTLVADAFLNHRIEGYSGGHDEWGFRNKRRPETADIVCVGDSQTYGLAATARDSWPTVLGTLRAETVYNMGLGGYGPIQYLYLMRTKAAELHPKTIIVGFYFGNDLLDVYNVVRTNKNWSSYGNLGSEPIEQSLVFPRQPRRFLGPFRDWLSKNSILYVLVTQLPILDFVRAHEVQSLTPEEAEKRIAFRDSKHSVLFNLDERSRFVDMRDVRIQGAMEITKRIFLEMQNVSKREDTRLIVALIPTKESVYKGLLDQAGSSGKSPRLSAAIAQENIARDTIVSFLQEHHFEVVDLLPALEANVAERDLYPFADAHPNKYGYRTIAETLNAYLDTHR